MPQGLLWMILALPKLPLHTLSRGHRGRMSSRSASIEDKKWRELLRLDADARTLLDQIVEQEPRFFRGHCNRIGTNGRDGTIIRACRSLQISHRYFELVGFAAHLLASAMSSNGRQPSLWKARTSNADQLFVAAIEGP